MQIAQDVHVLSTQGREGFSANSLLILDDQPALVNPGPLESAFELLDEIEALIPWERVLFLAVASTRPEHFSGIEPLLAALPNVRVLALDHPLMREKLQIWAVGRPVWLVGEGEEVKLGRRTLKFFHLPLPSAPEMAGVWIEPEKILFSCGLASSLQPFEAEGPPSLQGLREAFLRFVGEENRGEPRQALEKALALKPSLLCPAHGPLSCREPEKPLRDWLQLAKE